VRPRGTARVHRHPPVPPGGELRTYAVTGSASGIGAALARQLRDEGHRVVGVDLRDAEVNADLATPAGRRKAVAGVLAATERLDGVAAVAGIAAASPATVAVNYYGAVAVLEGLRPALARSPAPRAAVVSSVAALRAVDDPLLAAMLTGAEDEALSLASALADDEASREGGIIYRTSKRAISLWVRAAAPTDGWARASIPLNAVAPGFVETPMTARLLGDPARRARVVADYPAPLNGPATTPEVPARLLVWLLGEANGFMTGQVIFCDGGADAIARPMEI
jgi:NAD(P)-dependent dehydrogenase (short-subunit alcohol dehydrogenase family)